MPEAPVLGRPASASVTSGELKPLSSRRERPRLLVAVDGFGGSQRQLVWALQEAARRDATVLAVMVVDPDETTETRIATRTDLQAQVLVAEGQAGVHGRSLTALLDPYVFEALAGTTRGGDLVVVGPYRKTVLRPAMPLPPARRPLAPCA